MANKKLKPCDIDSSKLWCTVSIEWSKARKLVLVPNLSCTAFTHKTWLTQSHIGSHFGALLKLQNWSSLCPINSLLHYVSPTTTFPHHPQRHLIKSYSEGLMKSEHQHQTLNVYWGCDEHFYWVVWLKLDRCAKSQLAKKLCWCNKCQPAVICVF